MSVKRLAKHVKKFLMAYVAASVATGVALGDTLPKNVFATPAVKHVVLALAIATIFPSMIQLKPRDLGRALRSYRGLDSPPFSSSLSGRR